MKSLKIKYKQLKDLTKKVDNINWEKEKEKKYKYIDLSSVDRETGMILNTEEIDYITAPSRAKQIIRKNDVLFATTRPTQMRSCIINVAFDFGICSTGYCVLRPDCDQVLPEWILLNLKLTPFFNYVKSKQSGANYPAVSDTIVKSFIIPVPPVEEQRRIADILGECDRVIELKQKLINEEEKRKKYLMSVLLSPDSGVRLPGFSEPWKKEKTSQFGKLITGNTPSTLILDYYGNDYFWVTPTDICSKYVEYTERKLSKKGYNISKQIDKNSLLITCIASIGKNIILKENGSCNQQINAITPNKNYDCEFLYYLFEYFKKKLLSLAGITATPIINLSTFSKIEFFVPTIEEQKAIADILSCQDSKIDLLKKELEEWKTKKKSLMQLLLTGLVRV